MAVLVMATFGITVMAMGGFEQILQPNSYWTTNTFNIIVLIGGFVAAIIGGLVCALIARHSAAGFALAAIVLAYGIGSAMMNMKKPDPPARTDGARQGAELVCVQYAVARGDWRDHWIAACLEKDSRQSGKLRQTRRLI